MISLKDFPFKENQIEPSLGISKERFDYTKPLDPVEKILESSGTDERKIEAITEILIRDYKIVDGSFARILACFAVDNKLLLNREKKRLKKVYKKSLKQNKYNSKKQ